MVLMNSVLQEDHGGSSLRMVIIHMIPILTFILFEIILQIGRKSVTSSSYPIKTFLVVHDLYVFHRTSTTTTTIVSNFPYIPLNFEKYFQKHFYVTYSHIQIPFLCHFDSIIFSFRNISVFLLH